MNRINSQQVRRMEQVIEKLENRKKFMMLKMRDVVDKYYTLSFKYNEIEDEFEKQKIQEKYPTETYNLDNEDAEYYIGLYRGIYETTTFFKTFMEPEQYFREVIYKCEYGEWDNKELFDYLLHEASDDEIWDYQIESGELDFENNIK